jgi:ribonucleoside-diphosphate reductase alpha chain
MEWLNEYSRKFLDNGYLIEGQSAEERIRFMADTAERINGTKGLADKIYNYASKGFYSFSSPVWSNFGLERGLPISCFGSYLWDDMANILFTNAEVGMMSKYGWGTSGYFGALRPRGAEIKNNGASSGAVHFMQLFDKGIDIVSQGAVRRGSFAAYLPVEHDDIEEFLEIGKEGNPIQRITTWVTVTDAWLEEMKGWDAEKRAIWAKVIQARGEMGYPYILFSDNCNNGAPDVYQDKKMKIQASNLCTEIMLPSSTDESFVCCLNSINIAKYDQWKDTDAVECMIYFLDAVLQEFVDKLAAFRDSDDKDDRLAFTFMERAYNFASNHRALGLGALGWHSYLQSKMIPFEHPDAMALNKEIFELIHDRSYKASADLADQLGEAPLLKWYGRRNTTLNAIAPNTSSAFILGQVSQGIEPWWSNAYVKDLAKMKVTIKNKELEKLLEEKGENTRDIWASIRDHDGSVRHLDFLTQLEKDVFKTFSEINQFVVIDQAADRQKFIDQAQSLNLMVHPDTSAKDINGLYMDAWKQGIKTLYYQHSKSAAQELSRKISCVWCEG